MNIQKVNGVNDENDSNNHLCNTINSDETSVANPIPNPTANDITLPVILNKDIAVSIAIYNSIGQKQQQEVNSMGIKGLNLISLPTTSLAQGCYIIKTTIDDKVYIKKFIKLGKE